jgi:hypothetical protein
MVTCAYLDELFALNQAAVHPHWAFERYRRAYRRLVALYFLGGLI